MVHTFTTNPPSTSASFTSESFEGTGYSGGLQYTALQHFPIRGYTCILDVWLWLKSCDCR